MSSCSHGEETPRYANGRCVLCNRERAAAYYKANKEEAKHYRKQRYSQKAEEILAQKKEYSQRPDVQDRTDTYMREYRERNREEINARQRERNKRDAEKIRAADKLRRAKKSKPRIVVWDKEYRAKYARERNRARRIMDVQYKLAANLRGRLNGAIRNGFKGGSAVRDLGCSIDAFKKYIEGQFLPGMTWKNWSPSGWHLDHETPLSAFDLTDRDQLLRACHYTNLQPLWALDNIRKSAHTNKAFSSIVRADSPHPEIPPDVRAVRPAPA